MIESRIQEMAARRRELAARLNVFDASLWLGRPQGFPLATEFDAAALGTAMTEHFIAGGLVSHWRGKTVSPQEGNAALERASLDSIGKPVYTIAPGLPLFPLEDGPLPGLTDLPSRVRGVRVFPKTHGFPLADWSVGGLCQWLLERRLPLFIWHTELDWQDLNRLAKTFSGLSIVIESQVRKIIYHTRPLLALMRDCPNVYLEISNLTGPCFESALDCVGPERLIYGSFLPANDPFVPLGILLDADMADADRALVAGENLRHLIGEGPS